MYKIQYQKVINVLNKKSKNYRGFQTKKPVSINHESRKNYDSNNEVKFDTYFLSSNLNDCGDS